MKLNKPEALSHVLYEMWMMHECYRRLHDKEPQPDDVTRNLRLEGFLIHARCLYEFFSDKTGWDGDLRPTEFTRMAAQPLPSKADLPNRMHWEIAHLTDKRKAAIDEKMWDTALVLWTLAPHCLEFLNAVKTDEGLLGFENNGVRVRELILAFTPPTLYDYDSFSRGTEPMSSSITGTTMTGMDSALDTTDGTGGHSI